ncbi:unnamed protein product [Rhizophagus irregularis]|nr:unnamed protein product [Rhizophagus irregularis]
MIFEQTISKKQTTYTRKFLRSDVRCLSSEAIEEIRNTQNNISNAQQDEITYTEYLMDNENDANSNGLNTITNGRKDKVSQKKKASIKPKDESFSAGKIANSFKDDTFRREFDLNKLVNITREAVMHLIYSP